MNDRSERRARGTYDGFRAVSEGAVGAANLDFDHLGRNGGKEGKAERETSCCRDEHGYQRRTKRKEMRDD